MCISKKIIACKKQHIAISKPFFRTAQNKICETYHAYSTVLVGAELGVSRLELNADALESIVFSISALLLVSACGRILPHYI